MKRFILSRNSRGFSLVESLLALFINSLVLILLGHVFSSLQLIQTTLHSDKNIEWHLFLNQVENDINTKTLTKKREHELTFLEKKSTDVISYEWRNSEVVRTKNSSGYVPMISKLKSVRYDDKSSNQLVGVRINFINGQILEGTIKVEPHSE